MSVYLADPDVTIHQGDVLETLRKLPDESVHMCCTSPPFYGLRDYGTGAWEGGEVEGCDHLMPPGGGTQASGLANYDNGLNQDTIDAKVEQRRQAYPQLCGKCGARRVDQQIGLEATPDLWVARLVEVFREVRRVLRDDGTLWLEIGDSYASAPAGNKTIRLEIGNARMSRQTADALHAGAQHDKTRIPGVKPKDMIGAPWLLAFALRADGWYLRSEIIWSKPNPMPESVTDRPTTSHSRVFLLSKQARYFYDADAVREPYNGPMYEGRDNGAILNGDRADKGRTVGMNNPAGRNRRSVWDIPTQPYPEAHFATWPEKLVEPMILAGTSERGVCPECGTPWERVVTVSYSPSHKGGRMLYRGDARRDPATRTDLPAERLDKDIETTGWQPTCGHADPEGSQRWAENRAGPVPATVLDPFGGSGTTAHVARKLGRRAILIELNAEYCALAARRLQQQSLFA